MRAGLLARAGLTDAEVDLLRRHAAGIGSRLMARGLQAEAEMIDRRFQRILSKLGTASQRRAARLVKPCSLIWRLPGRPKPDVRANCRGVTASGRNCAEWDDPRRRARSQSLIAGRSISHSAKERLRKPSSDSERPPTDSVSH